MVSPEVSPMTASTPVLESDLALNTLHANFLSLLPRIQRHARIAFRHVKCQTQKDEAIAEVVALAWKWYRSLAKKGRDGADYPSALASFATRAVRSGRRLCGHE